MDTNLLLVFVIGQSDAALVERFKRTCAFDREDYELLNRFLSQFQTIITSPFVLTEVSNLAMQLPSGTGRDNVFQKLAEKLNTILEMQTASVSVSDETCFVRLGLTDSSISLFAKQDLLVLTDDLKLYAHLCSCGIEAINFNHIRPFGWKS